MSTQLPSKNPTGYLGLRETNVGQLYFRPDDPVDAVDFRPYTPGDRWINTTLNRVWTLVKKTATSGTWIGVTAGPAQITQFTVDIGVPVFPVLNNVNLIGNAVAGVTTINSAMDTVTISVNDATVATKGVASFDPVSFAVVGGNVSLTAALASQYTTDIGGPAVPALNNLNVLGDIPSGVITTTTAPDTVSISVNDATVATKGVASFNPVDFAVAGGVVSLIAPISGALIQQVRATTNAYFSVGTGIPYDDTIPQQAEGDEVLTATITPTNAASILVIEFSGFAGSENVSGPITTALFRDATNDALNASMRHSSTNQIFTTDIPLRHSMVAGGIVPTTFKIRVGGVPLGALVWINGTAYGGNHRCFGGVASCVLTVSELVP